MEPLNDCPDVKKLVDVCSDGYFELGAHNWHKGLKICSPELLFFWLIGF